MNTILDDVALPDINLVLALKHSWCTTTQVLDWLAETKCTTMTAMLYSQICSYDRTGNHYLSNGKHLLYAITKGVSFHVYKAIYALMDLPMDVCMVADEPKGNTIKEIYPITNDFSVQAWMKKEMSYDLVNNTLAMSGTMTENMLSLNVFNMYIKCNHIPTPVLAENIFEHNMLMDTLFQYDLFEIMSMLIHKEPYHTSIKEWYTKIIGRLKKLSRLNASYYDIVKPEYNKILSKLHTLHLPSLNETIVLHKQFPVLFVDLMSLSDIAQCIYACSTIEEQGYLLGLPIHTINTTPALVKQHLHILTEMGIDRYLASIENNNKRAMEQYARSYGASFIEEEDILTGASMYTYNLVDIVPYISYGKMHLYVRDEANNLAEKNKDRYNAPISSVFLQSLVDRQRMAIQYQLGRAIPLADHYQRLLSNAEKEPAVAIRTNRQVDIPRIFPTVDFSYFSTPPSSHGSQSSMLLSENILDALRAFI